MKIALIQDNYTVGSIVANSQQIIDKIKYAKSAGANLILFSELSLCGAAAFDMFKQSAFINKCNVELVRIAAETENVTVIMGAPYLENNNLFNAAVIIENGEIKDFITKNNFFFDNLLSDYKYFTNTIKNNLLTLNNFTLLIEVGFNFRNKAKVEELIVEIKIKKPNLLVFLSANYYQGDNIEHNTLSQIAFKTGVKVVYLNNIGASGSLIFHGKSLIIDEKGANIKMLNAFKKDFTIFDFIKNDFVQDAKSNLYENDYIANIYNALILGISDYFKKNNFKKAIIGLSGGLDSAVVYALACAALGAENVYCIMLPSIFSTEHSINDASKLLEIYSGEKNIISINSVYQSVTDLLEPYFKNLKFDVTEENIQSRIRGLLLMAFANKFNYILLNTSNKSEIAVGYGTMYGDMCGAISVLGDVYKTDVYKLAYFINKNKILIPENIISKPPSAELRPNQKDSDSLPDYDLLDTILKLLIESSKTIDDLVNLGHDKNIVAKIRNMIDRNEWKRYQSPPILKVSKNTFGLDIKMPLVNVF